MVNLPFLEGINTAGVYSKTVASGLVIGKALFWIITIGVVAYFLIHRFSFNHKVYIIAKRGGRTVSIAEDRAKFVRKKGVHKMVFGSWIRRNIKLPIPDPHLIFNGPRGKPTIFLYKYGEKDYSPIAMTTNNWGMLKRKEQADASDSYATVDVTQVLDVADFLKLEPVASHIDFWNIQTKKEITEQFFKPTFFEKYGAQIIMIIAIMAVVVIIWMTLGKIDDVAQALNSGLANANRVGGQVVS